MARDIFSDTPLRVSEADEDLKPDHLRFGLPFDPALEPDDPLEPDDGLGETTTDLSFDQVDSLHHVLGEWLEEHSV